MVAFWWGMGLFSVKMKIEKQSSERKMYGPCRAAGRREKKRSKPPFSSKYFLIWVWILRSMEQLCRSSRSSRKNTKKNLILDLCPQHRSKPDQTWCEEEKINIIVRPELGQCFLSWGVEWMIRISHHITGSSPPVRQKQFSISLGDVQNFLMMKRKRYNNGVDVPTPVIKLRPPWQHIFQHAGTLDYSEPQPWPLPWFFFIRTVTFGKP